MIEYRVAEPTDAKALIEYTKKVGGETDNLSFGEDAFNIPVDREVRFIARFKNPKNGVMLVATENGHIVANASIERCKAERYTHRAELSITVLKEYWGLGIATKLINRLIEQAKEIGIEVVYLDVRSDNIRAISLYKKLGFAFVGRFRRYIKINNEYFDGDLMELLL